MSARALLVCQGVTRVAEGGAPRTTIRLRRVAGVPGAERCDFWSHGGIDLVVADDAAPQFEPGKSFLVTIEEAP